MGLIKNVLKHQFNVDFAKTCNLKMLKEKTLSVQSQFSKFFPFKHSENKNNKRILLILRPKGSRLLV